MKPRARSTIDESIAAGGDGVGAQRRRRGLRAAHRARRPRRARDSTCGSASRAGRSTTIARAVAGSHRAAVRALPRDRCGGCQLQHLSYTTRSSRRSGGSFATRSRASASAHGRPSDGRGRATAQWRYRRKLTLAMRRRRDGDWVIGCTRTTIPSPSLQLERLPDHRRARDGDLARGHVRRSPHFPPADELRAFVRLVDRRRGRRRWKVARRGQRDQQFFDAVPSRAAALVEARRTGRAQLVARASRTQRRRVVRAGESRGRGRAARYVLDRARAHRPTTRRRRVRRLRCDGDPARANDGARVVAIELDRDASARCAARLPAGSRAVRGARRGRAADAHCPPTSSLINPPRAGMRRACRELAADVDAARRAP